MEFDIRIMNGRVLDGTAGDAIDCDIGINDDLITKMGDLSACSSPQTIDAGGMVVCPGFIDTHSHSDTYLLIEPTAASKLYQGITTEICGNCGASAAPLNGEYKMPSDWCAQLAAVAHGAKRRAHGDSTANTAPHAPCSMRHALSSMPHAPSSMRPAPRSTPHALSWKTVAEYRALYDEVRPAINAALLIGHNTLHAGICGYEPRAATTDEMRRMKKELEKALDEGGIGLSSGLAYPPGSAVPREEIIELCRLVAKHGGLYTTHMRSESGELLEAIDEAIDIAVQSGTRLQISHLKASGQSNWSKIDAAFEKIRSAREKIPVGSDRYPYTAGCTDLDILLPQWATYGGRDAILARIRNPDTRKELRAAFDDKPPDYWDNVMVGSTRFEVFKGRYLPDVADELGMETVDAFLHLIDSDDLGTGGIFFSMSESNLWRVLAEPYVSIGSDGSMRAPWGPLSSDHPHPRAYGSHTRFLRAALDGVTVPLPEAIYKMTGLPAEQFGLKNRGLLKEGYAADILVFDPDRLKENTTYADPHQLSEGMRHVIVNGAYSLKNGKHTDERNGGFLSAKN